MNTLGQDLRLAIRTLARSPGFTLVAGLTLALILGANTAMFSVVDGILLRALPYFEPDRLIDVAILLPPAEGRPGHRSYLSNRQLEAWREGSRTIEDIAGYRTDTFTWNGQDGPRRIRGARASAALFSILGVDPVLGRTFNEEVVRSGTPVTVLSYGFWQSRYAGDPGVLGKSVALDGRPHTVLAVMPRSFFFPDHETELWVPLEPTAGAAPDVVSVEYSPAVARLRPGMSIALARTEAQSVVQAVSGEEAAPPSETPAGRVHLTPLKDEMVAGARPALVALFAAVGLVLLIGCANLANLVLARSASREQEMAVRVALGCSRGRLVRQVLTETLVLALAGGAGGLLLAFGTLGLLPSILPGSLPRLAEVQLDTGVFLFALLLSALTGVLFGLWPALRSTRPSLVGTLRRGSIEVSGGRSSRNALIVTEVALAVVLLIGAGLLLRSFLHLIAIEPGYDPDRALETTLELDPARYPDPAGRIALFDRLLARLTAQPDVEAAGVVGFPPLTSRFTLTSLEILGQPPARTLAVPQMTSAGYLPALGMRLAAGRWLTANDASSLAPAAVVNQTFVRQYLAGKKPLGARLKVRETTFEIVGVVEDVRLLGLDRDPQPELFTSYHQAEAISGAGPSRLTVVARTGGDPTTLVPILRSLVLELDPTLPLEDVRTLRDHLSESVAAPRSYAMLLGLFALLALVLASAGIYGVLAYFVAQRSREVGVRRALGAQTANILRLVLREGLLVVAAGLVLGTIAAIGVTRVLETLLFGIPRMDPWTLGVAPAVLFAVAGLACYLPARRATRVDPIVALRWD